LAVKTFEEALVEKENKKERKKANKTRHQPTEAVPTRPNRADWRL
jgi:hypothetical protein